MFTLFAMGTQLSAQSIYGKVSDEKGEALIGVSVYIQGTTSGVITVVNGIYQMNNLDSGS